MRAEVLGGNDRALARLARAFPYDYIEIVQEALRDKVCVEGGSMAV